MIFSDRQYQVARAELEKLNAALGAAVESGSRLREVTEDQEQQELLHRIYVDALRGQADDIASEIAEYEQLKSGHVSFSKCSSLSDLPRVLVQARIAKGLSQTALAERLDMKPQQIQRYEASSYMSASLARLIEVADVLEVKISESFEDKEADVKNSVFAWSAADDVAWSRLPIKEMIKRRWFEVAEFQNHVDAVRSFFISAAGSKFVTALHRKKVRSDNIPNEFALLAWQARVLHLAREMGRSEKVGEYTFSDSWLGDLVNLTREEDGPVRARDLLAKQGIFLVVERHLPGTYLDGAAMLSAEGQPVIGLTLRHDRLDNFWFVLLHELGHVLLHLHRNFRFDFFDEEVGSDSDQIESEADKFALDTLIPSELWARCLSRFTISPEAVRIDAKRLGVHPSILAGRIRKERNDYTVLSELVGNGSVRIQFSEEDDGGR